METIRNALGQERRRPVVTIILGGMEYWLNGAAGDTKRYPDPRPMNPRDPVNGGYAGKTPTVVSGFIQSGLRLCGDKEHRTSSSRRRKSYETTFPQRTRST